jgi:membrane protease YdiL (CAAX protease family)
VGPAGRGLYWRALLCWPVALALWWVIFAWQPANFWLLMAGGTASLGLLALSLRGPFPLREGLRQGDFALGLGSAAALYAVFWVGDAAIRALVPAAARQVGSVYGVAAQAPWPLIALLLVAVIGPGEELFWRGLVLAGLRERLPAWTAVAVAAVLYAAVHVVSRNPMLVLAALVGGLWWGGMYVRVGRIAPVIVSHVLWDLAVLLFFPLR